MAAERKLRPTSWRAIPTWLAVGCILIAVAVLDPGRHDQVGAQEAEDVPAVISTLAGLLPQDDGDPFVAEFLVTPTDAGSVADDPLGDVNSGAQDEAATEGPDLVRFSWFTVPAQPLVDSFAALLASEPQPAGITFYGQESWVAPAPTATLVALVAEFDRPLSVTLGNACVTQLNVRLPGPTTPEERLAARDPNRDTNISYQLAGWDTLPAYALEADTSTPSFSTPVPASSLFGAVLDSQAALFIPRSQLEEVSAVRVSVRCSNLEPADVTTDQSDLVPFDSTSLATAYLGPASALPAPSTTTVATTTSDSTADDEPEAALDAAPGITAVDSSTQRDLLGPWALLIGLAMVAAGGWVLHRTPPWRRPDGSSTQPGAE